jgi:hypothetical protein
MSPLYNRLLKVLQALNTGNTNEAVDLLIEIMDDEWSGKGPWCQTKPSPGPGMVRATLDDGSEFDVPIEWTTLKCDERCVGRCGSHWSNDAHLRSVRCNDEWRCDGTGPIHSAALGVDPERV